MSRLWDVTLTLSADLPVWPGDPAASIVRTEKIEEGADANVSRLTMSAHGGTHVDAPYHFIAGGRTADHLPLDVLVGPAYVAELPEGCAVIDAEAVHHLALPDGTTRLLLKTRNSKLWAQKNAGFDANYVGVDASGAQALLEYGIRLVGIDYLSIAPFDQTRPTHEILLAAGVVVVEGLDLSAVSPGQYRLYCLPLKLAGADGAPARVVLETDD